VGLPIFGHKRGAPTGKPTGDSFSVHINPKKLRGGKAGLEGGSLRGRIKTAGKKYRNWGGPWKKKFLVVVYGIFLLKEFLGTKNLNTAGFDFRVGAFGRMEALTTEKTGGARGEPVLGPGNGGLVRPTSLGERALLGKFFSVFPTGA